MQTTKWAAIAAAVVFAALGAGCGGGGGGSSAAGASTGALSPSQGNGTGQTTGAPSAAELAQRARGELLSIEALAPLARCNIIRDPSCGTGGQGLLGGLASLVQRAVTQVGAGALPEAAIAATAKCDVTPHHIVYRSVGPASQAATVSGAIYLPSGSHAHCQSNLPVVIYNRGTEWIKARRMSRVDADASNVATQGQIVVATLAAQGFVVVTSDYLGYGDSNFPYHPYLHVESQAAANVDAYRAALGWLTQQGVALSGKVFSTGFSQGGHASLATQKMLERDFANINFVAAMHMAGPYALEETFLTGPSYNPYMMEDRKSGTVLAPYVGPMLIHGLKRSYGSSIYAEASDVFDPYWVARAGDIENVLPGDFGPGTLSNNNRMPSTMAGNWDAASESFVFDENGNSTDIALYTNAFLQRVASNAQDPVRQALRENSFVIKNDTGNFVMNGWAPQRPLRLCHGSSDPAVPYANTEALQQALSLPPQAVVNVEPVAMEMARMVVRIRQLVINPGAREVQKQVNESYHGEYEPLLCLAVASNYFASLR
jgi:hypothetical protein